MGVPASLLPELEDVVRHGSAEKRAETLRRITTLFLDGAPSFNAEHVALFDDVIGCLVVEIEAKTLAELARRIAPIPNAPAGVVSALAKNDDIAVAGPVLKQARLADPDLKYIAETKSQAHLLAMSTRLGISEALADILVERGDREVARSIANNQHAQLSDNAFTTLVKRAEQDGVLAEKVGMRTDIPPRLFRQLLMQASEVVQTAPAGKGQAGNPSRNPAHPCASYRRSRCEGRASQLHRRTRGGARPASRAQAWRSRYHRICQSRKVRRDDCCAFNHVRSAGRGRG